jgi:hypothetical protein
VTRSWPRKRTRSPTADAAAAEGDTLSDRVKPLEGTAERLGTRRRMREFRLPSAHPFKALRLQLVLGDERAEVVLDNLERLEHRPLS